MIMLGYLVAFAYFNARMFNIVFGNTILGSHSFQASMTTRGYLGLLLGNLVLMVVTVGLAYPLAKVRTARYKAAHLDAVISGSLDNFAAAETERVSALGEELGQALDMDISL